MMKRFLVVICCVATLSAKKPAVGASHPTPQEAVEQYCSASDIDHVFFAPDNGAVYKSIILGLIENTMAGGSISMAAFRFTDKDVRDALIVAHKRGVTVEAVFDPGAMTSAFYSVALSLCEAGIAVYQYISVGLIPPSQRTEELQGIAGPQRISYQAIMHHKSIVFKRTVGGKDVVVFGSLNFTTAGFYGNEEAVQVRNKPAVVEAFKSHFENLKRRSYSVETYRKGEMLRLKTAE